MAAPEGMADDRIAVVLVSGGVGAGKSSCLNALLTTLPAGARAAVCTHAFALSFGLETTAVAGGAVVFSDEVYDFGGGCVCCSPRGDFTRFLERLWAAHGAGSASAVTHLLVETTGVAEPLVFARLFYTEPLRARFRLAASVHVLDAAAPPPPARDDADAPAWAAAASVVAVNARRGGGGATAAPTPPRSPSPPEAPAAPHTTVSAGVDAGVELVTGAAGAATELADVLIDAGMSIASISLDGAGGMAAGVASSVASLATLDVGSSGEHLGRAGSSAFATVSSGTGVLLGAATALGAATVQRADALGQRAWLVAATVTSAFVDDAASLPGHVTSLSLGASRGIAGAVFAAAAAGLQASQGALAELLLPHGAPRLLLSLAPGPDAAEAGGMLWAAIASEAGAFSLERAVELDPSFLEPPDAFDDVPPLLVPAARGGHAARVACVCVAEVGAPVLEAKLRRWLGELAASGALLRAKGAVWVRADDADDDAGEPHVRELIIDGVRDVVSFRERMADSEDDAPAAPASPATPLCGDAACAVRAHARPDASHASRVFLVLAEGGPAAPALKAAFRSCFVPDGFTWAADIEIDFPQVAAGGSPPPPRCIERQLDGGGPRVLLWRVGGRFYACEPTCPHAGAPLAEGAVLDMEDCAKCVVHAACASLLADAACTAAPRWGRCCRARTTCSPGTSPPARPCPRWAAARCARTASPKCWARCTWGRARARWAPRPARTTRPRARSGGPRGGTEACECTREDDAPLLIAAEMTAFSVW